MTNTNDLNDAILDLAERLRDLNMDRDSCCDVVAEDWGIRPELLRRRFTLRYHADPKSYDPFISDRASHQKAIRMMHDDRLLFSEWTQWISPGRETSPPRIKISGLMVKTKNMRLVTLRNQRDGIISYIDEHCAERQSSVDEVFGNLSCFILAVIAAVSNPSETLRPVMAA